MRYLHTMIRVSDVEASLAFFCGGLGLEEIRRIDDEKGRYTLIYLAAPEDAAAARASAAPMIELTFNWDKEVYSGGRNFGHLAFAVNNIYDICSKLSGQGVTINRPPRDGYMAFVRTPDNISIELLQRGSSLEPTEPWKSMQNVGSW